MIQRIAFCLLACSVFLLTSCTKSKSKSAPCERATVCMINNTTDTIRYCWGCNMYTEKVAPGQKACREVLGPISSTSTVWVDFQTAGETRRILVDECNVEVTWR
ncbi:MAG: hypothetical protein EOP50_01215 [Sphingobacteriales bacterium]|nr:MAG: hypothetical protein EOP50_01215 [Sphingobacteriales bacterium]